MQQTPAPENFSSASVQNELPPPQMNFLVNKNIFEPEISVQNHQSHFGGFPFLKSSLAEDNPPLDYPVQDLHEGLNPDLPYLNFEPTLPFASLGAKRPDFLIHRKPGFGEEQFNLGYDDGCMRSRSGSNFDIKDCFHSTFEERNYLGLKAQFNPNLFKQNP